MKVIQAGIGGMGDVWLRTVLASTAVEYSGFVETNSDIAQKQAKKYGLDQSKIFSSLDEALALVPTDGVIDVTPPQFHQTISTTALEAGIPVLSEKPLANTIEAAQAIVDKANQTGVLHLVSQNYRYRPQTQTLKQILDAGELGQVSAVSVEFFREVHIGGFREVMAYPLIIDMAIHHFDLMRFFLGSDPVSIFAKSWNPEWSWFKGGASASMVLEFANQVNVTYTGSWCSMGKSTPWNGHWRFECEKGVLTLEQEQLFIHRTDEEVVPVETIDMPAQDQAYMLHQFHTAVAGGTTPPTTCQDNIKSLSIVFDAIESIESRNIVQPA